MSQLDLFAQPLRSATQNRSPYRPFDAVIARGVILEQLRRAGGKWVRRMALRRATGMRPSEVGSVLHKLASTGLVEFTESIEIIHPSHGFMGHTRGYRMLREAAA